MCYFRADERDSHSLSIYYGYAAEAAGKSRRYYNVLMLLTKYVSASALHGNEHIPLKPSVTK